MKSVKDWVEFFAAVGVGFASGWIWRNVTLQYRYPVDKKEPIKEVIKNEEKNL